MNFGDVLYIKGKKTVLKTCKNERKLTKISQNCAKHTKIKLKIIKKSAKCIYKNLPKTLDFGANI